MSCTAMCNLAVGQSGTIERVGDTPFGERLVQVGFVPGERVCRAYSDAHGFLSAYRIGNTLIALRRPDARSVRVDI